MIKKGQAAQSFLWPLHQKTTLSSKMIHVTANYPHQMFDSLRCATINYEITKHLDFTVSNVGDYNWKKIKLYRTVYVYM